MKCQGKFQYYPSKKMFCDMGICDLPVTKFVIWNLESTPLSVALSLCESHFNNMKENGRMDKGVIQKISFDDYIVASIIMS
jgi:hypothetical protein